MISVIIPTYNNANQLIETISSVCLQSFEDIEIIIIDDDSFDDTKNKIMHLNNSKIKYFKNSKNMGVSKSRIEGVKQSSGEYIAFLDDDDIWLDEKLSKQFELIQKRNLDFVMSDFIINNKVNQITYERSLKKVGSDFKKFIVKSPGPFFQCCLFRAAFLHQHINKIDSKAEPSEDWDFFISISKENPRVENISENLFQWNLSKKSQSSNYYKESCAIEYIINKHKKYITKNCNSAMMATHYRKLGSMFFYANHYSRAKQYYNKAIQCNFFSLKNIIFKIIYLLPEKIASQIIYKYTSQIK